MSGTTTIQTLPLTLNLGIIRSAMSAYFGEEARSTTVTFLGSRAVTSASQILASLISAFESLGAAQ
jgi:hypothetical protein